MKYAFVCLSVLPEAPLHAAMCFPKRPAGLMRDIGSE